jgi:hypothetical protein
MRAHSSRPFLTALLCLVLADGVAAEHVVLESNSPSYAPGQILAADASLTLDAQQFIVLATDDGRLMRIAGPHAGPAEGPPIADDALREIIGQLLGGPTPELGGLAGVRGGVDTPASRTVLDERADPWSIHSEQSGDQCFVSGRPLLVWRASAAARGGARVTDLESDAMARVEWDSGASLAPWPSEIAPRHEHIYLILLDGAVRSSAVRLHALEPGILDRGLVTAAWLAAKSCTAQARLLLHNASTTAN